MSDANKRLHDDIGLALGRAMMLLEMMGDDPTFSDESLRWAAHSLVQHAWQDYVGHTVLPLPAETHDMLATITAQTAIEDAKDRR